MKCLLCVCGLALLVVVRSEIVWSVAYSNRAQRNENVVNVVFCFFNRTKKLRPNARRASIWRWATRSRISSRKTMKSQKISRCVIYVCNALKIVLIHVFRKCFSKCYMQKVGFMNDDGEIEIELSFKELFRDREMQDDSKDMVNKILLKKITFLFKTMFYFVVSSLRPSKFVRKSMRTNQTVTWLAKRIAAFWRRWILNEFSF